jgi:hypothetical protein
MPLKKRTGFKSGYKSLRPKTVYILEANAGQERKEK